MPPKSALVTEGSAAKAKRPTSYHPLTTQGKQELVEWRSQHPRNVAREKPVDADDTAKAARSKKPRSFPPPGELTAIDQILHMKKTTTPSKGGWQFDKKKPVTTQEKLQAAQGMARTRGNRHGAGWDPKRRTMMAGLPTQLKRLGQVGLPAGMGRGGGDGDEGGVLFRKTEQSRRWSRMYPAQGASEIVAAAGDGVCRLLGLPDEVRARVWRYVVVERTTFVWPDSPTGREQPDLAMTCGQIRREVLPIFYAENTFGVTLSSRVPNNRPSGTGDNTDSRMCGIAAVQKWAEGLENEQNEDGKWLKLIRHWAFEYTGVYNVSSDPPSQSFLVIVNFPSRNDGGELQPPEVHQEAACILPGWDVFGKCSSGKAVRKLEDLVTTAQLLVQKSGGVQAQMMSNIAENLKNMKDELLEARCSR